MLQPVRAWSLWEPESTYVTEALNIEQVFLELSAVVHCTTHLLAEVLVHLRVQRLHVPAAGRDPSLSIDNEQLCRGPALASALPSATRQRVRPAAASAWQAGGRIDRLESHKSTLQNSIVSASESACRNVMHGFWQFRSWSSMCCTAA